MPGVPKTSTPTKYKLARHANVAVIALLGVLTALGLTSCGGDDADPPRTVAETPTPTATAAAQVPERVQGTFVRTLTRAQKKAAGAPLGEPPEGLPEGGMTLTVEPDGVAFTKHADGGDEELAFEPTGDRVKITGGAYCEDPAAEATYRWSRSGDTLTLKPIDNDCPDRRAVLVGTWRVE